MRSKGRLAIVGVALLLLAIVAWRDLPDYFVTWPERGMTRFLYRADIRDLAEYVNKNPDMTDFGVGGFLAGPWDKLAMDSDLQNSAEVRVRWYNPERAILLATGNEEAKAFRSRVPAPALDESSYTNSDNVAVAAFQLFRVIDDSQLTEDEAVCFQNGLCAQEAIYDAGSSQLLITWEVDRPLDMPAKPLISNPPPPDIYAGPRLLVFAQLLDDDDQLLAGDDGLWVDESTLWPGDRFRQVHYLSPPEGTGGHRILFGLYDPMTGNRILTEDGRDHIEVQIGS